MFVLMVLLSFLGLIARDWQKEVALPDAPPSFIGPRALQTGTDPLANVVPKDAKPVDLTDIDPLAPKYEEWKGKGATAKPDCRSAAFGHASVWRRSPRS